MENIKSGYNSNKFKINAPTWNDEFDLPDECILYQAFKFILSTLLINTRL